MVIRCRHTAEKPGAIANAPVTVSAKEEVI
jgi:hypothetical protein